MEVGEPPLEALHREVWEETGATILDLVGPVWHRSLLLRFRGEDRATRAAFPFAHARIRCPRG